MYQTNLANETTKFTQQSAGLVPSLANVTDGRMSVLALNAGPHISVRCVVFVPGPSAYQLHSHYHYHHRSYVCLYASSVPHFHSHSTFRHDSRSNVQTRAAICLVAFCSFSTVSNCIILTQQPDTVSLLWVMLLISSMTVL